MTKGKIYIVKNKQNNKVYVGQTICTVAHRKSKHKSDSNSLKGSGYDSKFYRAIRKYGIDSFEWSIIESDIEINNLDDAEKKYIKIHDSYLNGYNSTEGGQLSRGSMSDEVKKKISRSKIGQVPWNKGIPMSDDAKAKVSKNKKGQRKGIPRRPHVIESMLRGKKEKGYLKEYRDKLSISHGGTEFLVIDLKTNKEVGKWKNQSACARDLGLPQQQISKCLSGYKKSHKGYIFKRCNCG